MLRSRNVLTEVEQSPFVFNPDKSDLQRPYSLPSEIRSTDSTPSELPNSHLIQLATLGRQLSGLTLLRGNRLEPLTNGDEAYLAMAAATEEARRSVAHCSYIFRADDAGSLIIHALERAKSRGVEIRVLIDGIGSGYFFSATVRRLRKMWIRHARFLHSWQPWKMSYINLRTYKKVLLIDGKVGFVGA